MADPPRTPDSRPGASDDTDVRAGRGSTSGTPRWVKVSGVIALVLGLLLAVMMLFGGGRHGPAQHSGLGERGAETPLPSVTTSGGVGGQARLLGSPTP